MSAVSKWEVGGVSMVAVFYAAYRLGAFKILGVTIDTLPDLMLLVFFIVMILRGSLQWREAKKTSSTK